MAKILIVDDEEDIRSSLRAALERRGHSIVTAKNYKEGDGFARAPFDLIFLDVFLPDGNGVDLLKEILARDPRQIVIMISGHADIDTAVEATRAGAYDFIEKPLSLDRVLITIDNAGKTSRLITETTRLSARLYGDFIGESPLIARIRENIARSAPRATRFLILGESGTGKELAAHMIHRHSRKADGPFIAVNCAALPSELVESELFGHTAGAFTGASGSRKGRFQEADHGSVLLDEISEMPMDAQAKVLRLIETRQVTPVGSDKTVSIDCNIIAASNKDLGAMAKEGRFREDLLYRLNVVEFRIPSLREHREDIPLLARHFLARFADETGTTQKELSENAIRLLTSHDFPGNIRELKNLMERVNIYCESHRVGVDDIKPLMPRMQTDEIASLKEAVSRFEKDYIESAIAASGGNIAEAARKLGIERSHLYKKLKKHERG
jgi:two-component system nitrogen regulation response regulator NtrX